MASFIVVGVGIFSCVCMWRWLQSMFQRWNTEARTRTDGDIIRYIRGDFLDPQKCKVDWGWKEPQQVGQTVFFTIKFFNNNGHPFPVTESNNITVDISSDALANNLIGILEYLGTETDTRKDVYNMVKVTFVVSKSGIYNIAVAQDGSSIAGSPFKKSFLPGPLSPEHTTLTRTTHAALSVVVMTIERNHRLMIDARDEFDNKCASSISKYDLENKFDLRIREASDPTSCPFFMRELRSFNDAQSLSLDILMYQVGCFKASLRYNEEEIKNGNFDILVLNTTESDEVQNNVEKKNLNVYFECRLLSGIENMDDDFDEPLEGETSKRSRLKSSGEIFVFPFRTKSTPKSKSQSFSSSKQPKVFCYITPKQIIVKEFFLKIFPKKLFTFRLSPSTKVLCGGIDEVSSFPILLLNDGVQRKVLLACSRRDVLVATYVGILYANMGGQTNTFEAKMNHFYKQLSSHHNLSELNRNRDKIELSIDRTDLLNSSFKETKNFSTSDWINQFIITFHDENGLDWGGVNREWLHVLCKCLFEAKIDTADFNSQGSGLFRSMKDDRQALVLPSSSKASGFKLKMYEFAGKIVGKCMLESSIGGESSRQVSARFARSFLAQLIGLPISYTYFESDDRDLFMSKVKYILENDVSDMEMTFTEEIYSKTGTVESVVDLIPNGSNILVTNENKRKYLNKFAQYRLSESIKNEVDHFIKGLTSLVPEHLLSVFDENELELVMCGSSHISITDMKDFSNTTSFSAPVSDWFWAVLSSFTQEDLARLLQFTTGCSHLPPDGFKALEPRFKISSAPYHSAVSLPTAHTCFNELCIPLYESYDDLHRSLRVAITEGATGFGLV